MHEADLLCRLTSSMSASSVVRSHLWRSRFASESLRSQRLSHLMRHAWSPRSQTQSGDVAQACHADRHCTSQLNQRARPLMRRDIIKCGVETCDNRLACLRARHFADLQAFQEHCPHLSSFLSRSISGPLASSDLKHASSLLGRKGHSRSHGVILRPPAAEGAASYEYRSDASGPAQATRSHEQFDVPSSHTNTGRFRRRRIGQ